MPLRPELEHLAIAAAGIGAFVLDAATGDIEWSDVALDVLSLPDNEPADLETLMRHIDPRSRKAVRHGFAQALFECRALEARFCIVRSDGRMREVELRAKPIADAAGRPRHMLGVCMGDQTAA